VLPPPHADCRTINNNNEPPSAQQRRLRLFDPSTTARTNSNESHAANGNAPGCVGSDVGVSIANAVGAVIISVAVADFAPSVTDAVASEHAGAGGGPATEQLSWIGSGKAPSCGAIVITSLACPPEARVKLLDAAANEKSGVLIVYSALVTELLV
jgi:hypothetical protein